MYKRKYIDLLLKVKDDEHIKVISGIRRCGKSIILGQLADQLDDALYIDLEDFSNLALRNPQNLHDYVLTSPAKYILIDEIQFVPDFEDVINSLRKYKSLFVTGSNSFLLSANLSTILSGRYITIPTYPFSFAEINDYLGTNFDQYLLQGGMPTVSFEMDKQLRKMKLNSLIDTIIVNDILSYKQSIDANLLKVIFYYIIESIGSEVSIRNITNTLKSKGVNASHYKTSEIIDSLIESGTIYAINKYRIRGKERLIQNKKYYVADNAFTEILDFPSYGANLENIVYIHLLKYGFEIFYGDNDGKEIDFVGFKGDEVIYIQVSLSIEDKNTYIRETAAFKGLDGRKVLITKDDQSALIRDNLEYYSIEKFLKEFE